MNSSLDSSASLMVLVGQLDPLCSSQIEIMSRTEENGCSGIGSSRFLGDMEAYNSRL